MSRTLARSVTRPPAPAKSEPEPAAGPALLAPPSASSGTVLDVASAGATPAAERPPLPSLSAFLAQLENMALENHKLVDRLVERLAPVLVPPGSHHDDVLGRSEPQMSEFAIRIDAQVKALNETNRLLEDAARRLQI